MFASNLAKSKKIIALVVVVVVVVVVVICCCGWLVAVAAAAVFWSCKWPPFLLFLYFCIYMVVCLLSCFAGVLKRLRTKPIWMANNVILNMVDMNTCILYNIYSISY